MKKLAFYIFIFYSFSTFGQMEYQLSTDSKIQEGIPKGKILGPFSLESTIFSGTTREYWVYIPQQYNDTLTTNLLVSFDGLGIANNWNLPTVLDNLIYKKTIPTTIGVFIGIGTQTSAIENTYDRPYRSVEYDSRGKKTSIMVIDEILPDLLKKYNISTNPAKHLIAGNSSGGNAAFNVAWERPDIFGCVFSGVGSFTSLRGGHEFITLIRKTERKPIRIFLQDGSNDLNNFSGEWWMANNYMLSSLKWAGYDVNHFWGEDTHSYRNGAAIMPDVLRWFWGKSKKPFEPKNSKGNELIFESNSTWSLISKNLQSDSPISANLDGEFVFIDTSSLSLKKLDFNGKETLLTKLPTKYSGLSISSNNEICSCNSEKKQLEKIYPHSIEVIAKNVDCTQLIWTPKGVYFINSKATTVGFFNFSTKKTSLLNDIQNPSGISISTEHSFLNISVSNSVIGYSIGLDSNGNLLQSVPFFNYHAPYEETYSNASGMAVTSENLTLTATSLGIQISDQLGRTTHIFPLPNNERPISLAFGGPNMKILFVNTSEGVYARKTLLSGTASWQQPITPPKPGHVKSLKK